MWIHRLQRGTHANTLTIPKILADQGGWQPGAFIALRLKDHRTLELRLLGRTQDEAAQNLADTLRSDRTANRAAPRPDQPGDPESPG